MILWEGLGRDNPAVGIVCRGGVLAEGRPHPDGSVPGRATASEAACVCRGADGRVGDTVSLLKLFLSIKGPGG